MTNFTDAINMNKRLLNHILFWVAYFSSQIYMEANWNRNFYPEYTWWQLIYISTAAELSLTPARFALVYTSFYLFDRINFLKGHYLKIVLIYLLLLLVFTFVFRVNIVTITLPYVYQNAEYQKIFTLESFVRAFLDLAFLLAASNAIKLYLRKQTLNEKEKELSKQKIEIELQQLKSQINPHFLFNTLNSIYVLSIKNSVQTPEVVLRLSELLRFTLYESNKTDISAVEEAKLIDDYINLEKIRYSSRLKLTYIKDIDNPNERIKPLLLLPLVENAFKHGANESRSDTYIEISFIVKNKVFSFNISNSIENDSKTNSKNGIGLKNVRRQLELSYTDFTFNARASDKTFDVKLEINLAV